MAEAKGNIEKNHAQRLFNELANNVEILADKVYNCKQRFVRDDHGFILLRHEILKRSNLKLLLIILNDCEKHVYATILSYVRFRFHLGQFATVRNLAELSEKSKRVQVRLEAIRKEFHDILTKVEAMNRNPFRRLYTKQYLKNINHFVALMSWSGKLLTQAQKYLQEISQMNILPQLNFPTQDLVPNDDSTQ